MSYRSQILSAVYEADRLHAEFGTDAAAAREGRINVFGMLTERDIPVVFRPLTSLLGAYLHAPTQGVLVTTRRSLNVQRFTAAHELGHAVLGHQASLDSDDILSRAFFDLRTAYDVREVQANAFAAQLLTPTWLLAQHVSRQGWSRSDLLQAANVYQLSLRLGSSYTATCYALETARAIDAATREALIKKRRGLKQRLLPAYTRDNWYGDVWIVTDKDEGLILEGSRTDLVVFKLGEHPSSGYVWSLEQLTDSGLQVTEDKSEADGEVHIGGITFRRIIAEPISGGAMGRVLLEERRPWARSEPPLNRLEVDVAFVGPMQTGLLPAQRDKILAAA